MRGTILSVEYYIFIGVIGISSAIFLHNLKTRKKRNNADLFPELKRDILILASSDFSHYVSPEYGKEMDDLVIKEILALNTAAVYKTVISNNISVCGYGPIMTLLEYAKLIDPEVEVKILRRGHSGEVMASREVVDYISMLVYKKD